MEEGFTYPGWDQDFEEPAAKRLRFNPHYHQHSTGDHIAATTLGPIPHFLDPVIRGGPNSSEIFDGYWSGHLPDSQNSFSLPVDLSLNFDLFSNTGINYEDQLYPLSNESRPEDSARTTTGFNSYEQFAPNPVDDRGEISEAVCAIGESISYEDQICFGMVRVINLPLPRWTPRLIITDLRCTYNSLSVKLAILRVLNNSSYVLKAEPIVSE